MALPIFQRTVVNATGDIIPNAQVTVRAAGTQTLATIYQDEGGLTPKSNPFLTDSSGLARFYAAPQVVDVAVTAASGAISWIDIQLIDTQDITTIGSNFAAVETVADNISSVISVLDNIENIDTVADNIANVNATGSNIAAVIDAPNQAAIATTQAGIATTQANNASSSASTATTQAGIATTQAGIATTQAGIATTKASEAAASAASVNANNIVHAPNSGLPNEAGTVYTLDQGDVVQTTGNQTIAGVKTFSSQPIVTATQGTGANDVLKYGTINTSNSAPVKTALNAAGNAPIYACRAWVNFNGIPTTPIIRASGNVSSVARNATGKYTVSFANPMPDANFSPIAGGSRDVSVDGVEYKTSTFNPTTTSVEISSFSSATNSLNHGYVLVHVFR
jgi:hypothetical protein